MKKNQMRTSFFCKATGINVLLILLIIPVFITGCGASGSEIYDSAIEYRNRMDEEIKKASENAADTSQNAFENLEENAHKGAATLSTAIGLSLNKIGPIVIGVSLILGIILFAVTKRTAAIKLHQSALTLFIIGIPLTMLILMYGFAFLSSWFS